MKIHLLESSRGLFFLWLVTAAIAVSGCGRSSNNDNSSSPIGNSYTGPDCTGSSNVLKVAGVVGGATVKQDLALTTYDYNAGDQADNEGYLIVKNNTTDLLTIDFPSSEVTSDLAEASAKGKLTMGNDVYSNCLETDAFPSTIIIDQAAGFFRFILRQLHKNGDACAGTALAGAIEGCFIKK